MESDFSAQYFSTAENRNFEALLVRLRAFEQTMAHSFRQLDAKIVNLDEKVTSNKNSLTATKGSVTKLRDSLNELGDFVKENLSNLGLNEEKQNEKEGEEEGKEEEGGEKDGPEQQVNNEAEILVMDPFLGNNSFIGNYDGNPATPLLPWIEQFLDVLSLVTPALNEEAKLARLRFCLKGQARLHFDSIAPAPTTLQAALNSLKTHFNNGQTKILARQSLSICRQAPNETIFTFANRLTETIKAALIGENDDVINRRLLDEFLDRLNPDFQYELKLQRPVDFAHAYEFALHLELLHSTKRATTANINVSELAEKVEALAFSNANPHANHLCYGCHRGGHIRRNCPEERGNIGNSYTGKNSSVNWNNRDDRNQERYNDNNRRQYYNNDYNNRRNYESQRYDNRRYNDQRYDNENHFYGNPERRREYSGHHSRGNYGGNSGNSSRNHSRERGNPRSSRNYRSPSPYVRFVDARVANPEESRSKSPKIRFKRRESPTKRGTSPLFLM